MTTYTPLTIVSDQRLELMEMAVELEVDKLDFTFHSPQEEALWDELQAEFDARISRFGVVWAAEGQ